MNQDKLKAFEYLIKRVEQFKSSYLRNYPIPCNWGISTEDVNKALIVSVLKNDQIYEKFFHKVNTDITSQIETLLTWVSEQGVLILEPSHIREYLIQHFDLARIVRSTCKLALDRLRRTSQLALEVYRDPEIDDAYLTLNIRQHHYNQDILQQIEDLRAEYEMDLADSSGWFLVTTDFQPPL